MDKCFSQNPQELFAARKQRILDSVALKETDRVPFSLFAHFWPARYRGVTYEQAMHDIDLMNDCTAEVIRLLQPDNYFANQVLTGFGKQLAALDYKQLEWPGHGTDENATFQYVDKEYMSAGEYDDYLFDCQRRCKFSPLGRSKSSPLNVLRNTVVAGCPGSP